MKLYHGTSARHLKKIAKRGILPRATSGAKGNWNHTVLSNRDKVYLTNAYAGYYACCASRTADEAWAVIEVDTDRLNLDDMRPDEDFLAQVGQPPQRSPIKNLLKRTEWFRDRLDDFAHEWEKSLEFLGNAAHAGTITPSAISRVCLFEPASNPYVAFTCTDPSISVMNYLFLGGRYRALTRWFMGDNIEIDHVLGDTPLPSDVREKMAEQLAVTDGRVVTDLHSISS